jgi:hypothetical protein
LWFRHNGDILLLGTTAEEMLVAYVREKKVPGKDGKSYSYFQLVEGKRVDGKVKQRVIRYLGRFDSKADAEFAVEKEEAARRLGIGEKRFTIPTATKLLDELWQRQREGEDVTAEVGAIHDALSPYQSAQLNYNTLLGDYHYAWVARSLNGTGPRMTIRQAGEEREELRRRAYEQRFGA